MAHTFATDAKAKDAMAVDVSLNLFCYILIKLYYGNKVGTISINPTSVTKGFSTIIDQWSAKSLMITGGLYSTVLFFII